MRAKFTLVFRLSVPACAIPARRLVATVVRNTVSCYTTRILIVPLLYLSSFLEYYTIIKLAKQSIVHVSFIILGLYLVKRREFVRVDINF